MINADKLIELFQQALSEKWGYIWGAAGETWTQAKQNAATREMTVKYGKKWVGKRVADCSGLFYWAFKQLGGYMYHGSNTMYKKYTTASGAIAGGKKSNGNEIKNGTAVFKYNTTDGYHHVGLYIGDGKVIEAKGTQSGVIQSTLAGWTHWGELKGVEYGKPVPVVPLTGKCVVTAKSGKTVRLRQKASKSAQVIYDVPVSASVDVESDDMSWCKVKYEITGYIMKEYLKKE